MEFFNCNSLSKLISTKLKEWGFTFKGIKDNRKGEWFLFSQIIVLLAYFNPFWPTLISWPYYIKTVFSFLLIYGIYRAHLSLKTLGKNLSPLPEPMDSAILITKGIYKDCRHPLYQSLIFISIGFLGFKTSLIQLALLLLLSIILINKAKLEERKLKKKYPEYDYYILKTPAIFKSLILFDWRN